MAQLPSYAEVLTKDPDGSDPNDYSGKVKYLPHWPKIHPDHKPEHLNKPEHQWIFGHPVMILSKEPTEKGNVDVCVLRTFQGRGLEAEHGNSLQSRFYMPIHAEPPHRHPFTGHTFIGHPFTGHPIIPVLYLINPQYRVLKNCWVNLKKTYTVPFHSLEYFMWSDNTTIPTLMRTSYWQMVVYQRDVVPGLLREEAPPDTDQEDTEQAERDETVMVEAEREEAEREEAEREEAEREEADTEQAEMIEAVIDGVEMGQAEMDEASSIFVGSETSSAGILSGTVSSDGSSSQGSSLEGTSLEGSSVKGSSPDTPPPMVRLPSVRPPSVRPPTAHLPDGIVGMVYKEPAV